MNELFICINISGLIIKRMLAEVPAKQSKQVDAPATKKEDEAKASIYLVKSNTDLEV